MLNHIAAKKNKSVDLELIQLPQEDKVTESDQHYSRVEQMSTNFSNEMIGYFTLV